MKHRYKITIEEIPAQEDTAARSLQFSIENHDDIFFIVNHLEQRPDFSKEDAQAFGVGLKMFSEVMLSKKSEPLFAGFFPHFIDFMKTLKKG